MDTLIELYDERAIENVLAPDLFRPRRVIYLCPEAVTQDRPLQESLRRFFRERGVDAEIEFVECSLYRADRIAAQLRRLTERFPDCAIDITGGTDAALFAAGMLSATSSTPVFTYSHKRGRFYDISHASFADDLPCGLAYRVDEFFAMAGGTMRQGRVDSGLLGRYLDRFDAFFQIYLAHRREWVSAITYLQRASQHPSESEPLYVDCAYELKGERGSRVQADPELLRSLASIGYLRDLEIDEGERVRFSFRDSLIRGWLRDVGSVLELYMYKACLDAGCFQDVVCSAIVDWDGAHGHDLVSNEIDVAAARGIVPLFISCKTCEIRTEALNELAILHDRFGGSKAAKACIVTSEPCGAAARHRAAQLGITVIDLEELQAGLAADRLQVIMKVREQLG